MQHRILGATVVILSLTHPAWGQVEVKRLPGNRFRSVLRDPTPVASLPKHVVAPKGELSLFADFNDIDGEAIAIYLVNRTDRRIAFAAQDNNPYLKLDALGVDGIWDRAQGHVNSKCGNSYMRFPTLRPGEFFKTTGYHPSDGEPRTVRYRIYQDDAYVIDKDAIGLSRRTLPEAEKLPILLVSNSGSGIVRLVDINYSRKDCFAPRYGTFATVKALTEGESLGKCRGGHRYDAVRNLHRFPTAESFSLLNDLIKENDPQVAMEAVRALARMRLRYSPAGRRFQEILTGTDVGLRMFATHVLTDGDASPAELAFAKEQLAHDDLGVRSMAMSVIASRCKDDPEVKVYINSLCDTPDPKLQSIFDTLLLTECIDYWERRQKQSTTE